MEYDENCFSELWKLYWIGRKREYNFETFEISHKKTK